MRRRSSGGTGTASLGLEDNQGIDLSKVESPEGEETMYNNLQKKEDKDKRKRGCKEFLEQQWSKLTTWLLEVEMGVVWGIASLSIISFIFASIWYIDPALLTMVLQFQAADCTTVQSAYLIGISNCTWSSCRHGCTAEVYKCWQVQVNFTLVPKSHPIPPPWGSLTSFTLSKSPVESQPARLYPNVRGCGYPPQLQCQDFFSQFGELGAKYPCWVSHLDPNIAITELDLRRLKKEVMYSLVPLAIFILFTLYAFCRLGVFSICNPFRCCPTPADQAETATLTPKQLFRYKKTLMAKKAAALQSFQKCEIQNISIPATILEDVEIKEEGEFDTRSLDGREDGSVRDETGQGGLRVNISTDSRRKIVYVEGVGESGITSREPSDRIEMAVSPDP